MSYFLVYFVSCYLLILPARLCSLLCSCAPPQPESPSHTCLQLASLALPCSQCLSSTCTAASWWCSVYLSLCCSPHLFVGSSGFVPVLLCLFPAPWVFLVFLICSSCSFWFVLNFFFLWYFPFLTLCCHFYCLHFCSLKLTFCFQPAYLCVSAFDPHHFAFVGMT